MALLMVFFLLVFLAVVGGYLFDICRSLWQLAILSLKKELLAHKRLR